MSSTDDINGKVKLDIEAIRKGVNTILSANNITTDAQWSTFIDGRTDAQIMTMLRNYFKTLIKVM